MKVLDIGHFYELDVFDGTGEDHILLLRFMKRVGDGYPFNMKPAYSGTNCQEVLRVLIDRVKYLNKQIAHPQNAAILDHLRSALLAFEIRAAERHQRELIIYNTREPECEPACKQCGHVNCSHGKTEIQ